MAYRHYLQNSEQGCLLRDGGKLFVQRKHCALLSEVRGQGDHWAGVRDSGLRTI